MSPLPGHRLSERIEQGNMRRLMNKTFHPVPFIITTFGKKSNNLAKMTLKSTLGMFILNKK